MDKQLQEKFEKIKILENRRWNEIPAEKEIQLILNEILEMDPNNPIALNNLGAITSDQGKFEKALEILKRAENSGFKDRNLFENIGIAMMNISEITRRNAKYYFDKSQEFEENKWTILAYFDPQGH